MTKRGEVRRLPDGPVVLDASYAAAAGLPVLTGDRHWSTLQPLRLQIAVYNFRDPADTP